MVIGISTLGHPATPPLASGSAAQTAPDRATPAQATPKTAEDSQPLAAASLMRTVQATADQGRLVLAQAAVALQSDTPRQTELRALTAARIYDNTAQALGLLATAQSIAERIALLPEPGDLSLEASRMPPLGDDARPTGE